jgi:hypothetical protein
MKTTITILLPGRIVNIGESDNSVEIEAEVGPDPINEKWYDEIMKKLGPDKAGALHDELVDEATERYIQRLIRFKPTRKQ